MSNKLHRDILKRLPEGWRIVRRRKHVAFEGPDGKKIFFLLTPSDPRSVKNLMAEFRRKGVPVDGRK